MPEIAEVCRQPLRHGELSLKARHRLARELAREGYQRAYVLPNSIKSALIPFFADIPERIGFVGESRYGLINRRHTLNKALLPQMAERFAQLAETPGARCRRPLPLPRLTRPRATRGHAGSAGHRAPKSWRCSAPAPNTARPSAGRNGISRPWPMPWPTTGYAVWLLGLGQGPGHRRGDRQPHRPGQAAAQPLRRHLAEPGDRPAGRRILRRLQRFRPDARRRRPRPAADCALWLVVARLHAAAVATGPDPQSASRMQPLLQARMPAGSSRLPQQLEPQRVLDACLRFPGQVSG
jgi:hypothetical protein